MSSEKSLPTYKTVADMIDHAILKPNITRAELTEEVLNLKPYNIGALCVRSSDVSYVNELVADIDTKVITVVGFPHGTANTAGKVAETKAAIADGAAEIDMVINVGFLLSGMISEVTADIRKVVEAAHPLPVKVILETAFLTAETITAGAKASADAGAAFVKTSTGFNGGGANIDDLKVMKEAVAGRSELKASGGIRSLDTLLEMLDLGVTRFGTSATIAILDDLQSRYKTGRALGTVDESSY